MNKLDKENLELVEKREKILDNYAVQEWTETSKEWVWNGEVLFNICNEKLIKFDERHKTLTYSNNCACYDFKQNASKEDLEKLAKKLSAIII